MATERVAVLGARVLVLGKHAGTVRYVPEELTEPKGNDDAALLVGVELDRARGDSDGLAPDGRRLFECKPNFGLFLRVDKLAPFSPEDAAACVVQSAWLRFRAAQKFRQLVFAHAWNLLDNNQEQLNLKRSAQFKSAEHTLAQLTKQNSLTRTTSDLSKLSVGPSYRGPHVTWPLRLSNVLSLLESFKRGTILHHKYVSEILKEATRVFSPLPTLQEIVLAEGDKLTVVGDLHGQLQDLYTIFAINGLPSPTNKYLFNGDFVDRGLYGTEVVLTLLMFMLLYPKSVFLNRGNHESRNQNSWMGFEDEIWSKYSGLDGDEDEEKDPDRPVSMFEQFQTLFESLPLCALLQQKIFVVHGGLFSRDNVTLAHLKAISRKREPPLHQTGFEDKLFEDMLWSDPRAISSRQPSERGAGVEFGVDVTNNFCLVNRVALIIRSHECVPEGFEILHGGRLITLFSASRYCGTQMNKGAFLTLGPELQPEIQQFYARTLDSIEFSASESEATKTDEHGRNEEEDAAQKREVAAMQGVLEEDTLRMIAERICDHRPSLYWYFTQHDQEHHGAVPRLVWAEALRSVLQLDLPFLTYQKQLADADEATGLINYSRFLARYRIENDAIDSSGWQESIISLICKKLFIAMGAGDLNQAFQVFDADANGYIEFDEFSNALKKMDTGLSDQQVFALMRTADANDDGRIDFGEFAQRFEVIFTKSSRSTSGSVSLSSSVHGDDVDIDAELPEPSPSPLPSPSQLSPDVDDTAKASEDELPPPPPPSDEPVFARRISSVDESQPTFATAPATNVDAETMDALLQIGKALLAREGSLKYHFYHFDVNQDGVLSRNEFEKALTQLEFAFSPSLLDRIMDAVDTDGGHSIDYKEFVAAFAVQDVREKESAGTGDMTWQNSVLQQVSNVFYQHRIHIRNAFRMFDRSNTGVISKDEFRAGISAFNVVLNSPLSDDQMEELIAFLDVNKDGVISYKEFFDGFRVVDVQLAGDDSSSE